MNSIIKIVIRNNVAYATEFEGKQTALVLTERDFCNVIVKFERYSKIEIYDSDNTDIVVEILKHIEKPKTILCIYVSFIIFQKIYDNMISTLTYDYLCFKTPYVLPKNIRKEDKLMIAQNYESVKQYADQVHKLDIIEKVNWPSLKGIIVCTTIHVQESRLEEFMEYPIDMKGIEVDIYYQHLMEFLEYIKKCPNLEYLKITFCEYDDEDEDFPLDVDTITQELLQLEKCTTLEYHDATLNADMIIKANKFTKLKIESAIEITQEALECNYTLIDGYVNIFNSTEVTDDLIARNRSFQYNKRFATVKPIIHF